MLVFNSHICGAVDHFEAFKCAIMEYFKQDLHEYILTSTTKNPSCDLRYTLNDGSVLYVYHIGKRYYRIDFTCEAKR